MLEHAGMHICVLVHIWVHIYLHSLNEVTAFSLDLPHPSTILTLRRFLRFLSGETSDALGFSWDTSRNAYIPYRGPLQRCSALCHIKNSVLRATCIAYILCLSTLSPTNFHSTFWYCFPLSTARSRFA